MRIQEAPDHLPSRVIFELTELCNYRCIHCFVPHRMKGVSTTDAIRLSRKICSEGVPSISWTGGEPFLRKDIFEIVESVKGSGTVHTVNTNGSHVDSAIAHRTADLFRLARVSVYGTNTSFSANTGVVAKYNYETSFRAVRLFLDAGLPVQVNYPIVSPDVDEISIVVHDIARRFGNAIEELVLIPIVKVGPVMESKSAFPDTLAIQPMYKRLEGAAPFPLRLFAWKPGKHVLIKADGRAYAHPIASAPNGALLIGEPLDESIQEIWARFPAEFRSAHRQLTPSVDHLRD